MFSRKRSSCRASVLGRYLIHFNRNLTCCGMVGLSYCLELGRGWAADHVDYRFGLYREADGRIEVQTHSAYFEKQIVESLAAKGEFVYDAISGASPTGKPPLPGSSTVQLAKLHDIRRAGNVALDWRFGRNTLSPQVAYSKESDYESVGFSLSDAIDFNRKNTTLRFGVARTFDEVQRNGNPFPEPRNKNSTEGVIGISQLLSPNTIFTADFTYGRTAGYLTDPYKQILFTGWGDPNATDEEYRPAERTRQVLLMTLTQWIDPVNASAEFSYRFGHDSFGVYSHTAALTWHQRLGEHLILEPTFRYYEQSAADFYQTSVPGFFAGDGVTTRSEFYSADYRLSHLESFTYGLQATVLLGDHVYLDLGYQRYEMRGLDQQTAVAAYPKANMVTAGLRVWF